MWFVTLGSSTIGFTFFAAHHVDLTLVKQTTRYQQLLTDSEPYNTSERLQYYRGLFMEYRITFQETQHTLEECGEKEHPIAKVEIFHAFLEVYQYFYEG